MCEPRKHTGAAPSYVPRALAEYYLGRSSAITEECTHCYTAAQLGHIGAASRAARLQIEQGLPPSGYIGHLMTASEGGDSWACCHLATLHETGCQGAGLRMDMAEAMRLYRIAADQGRGEAQHRLVRPLRENVLLRLQVWVEGSMPPLLAWQRISQNRFEMGAANTRDGHPTTTTTTTNEGGQMEQVTTADVAPQQEQQQQQQQPETTAAERSCGCWLCYRPFPLSYTPAPPAQLEYLAPSSGYPRHVEASTGEEDEVAHIECGVCRQRTTINMRNLMDDLDDDAPRTPRSTWDKTRAPERTCIFHIGQPLEGYCETDQCMVCSQCMLGSHRTHRFTELAAQAHDSNQQAPTLIQSIHQQKDVLGWLAVGIEESIASLTTKQRTTEKEIEETFDRLMRELQRKKEALLSNTIKMFKKQKDTLKLQLKCVRYAAPHLAVSESKLVQLTNQQENRATQQQRSPSAPYIYHHGKYEAEEVTSLVALTKSRFLQNWKSPLDVCLVQNAFQVGIQEHAIISALESIDNLYLSKEDFALTALRNLALGNFEKAFQNCVAMFPPSPFGPLDGIRTNTAHAPKEIAARCLNPNKFEALGIILMLLLLDMRPVFLDRLGPFDRYPYLSLLTRLAILKDTSLGILQQVCSWVLSTSPRFTAYPHHHRERRSSAVVSRYMDHNGDDVRITSLIALVHVIQGYLVTVPQDSNAACGYWERAASTCGKQIAYKVPRALAEHYLGSDATTDHLLHLKTAAQLGNVCAAADLVQQWPLGRDDARWLVMASDGGHAWAQTHLAKLYEQGLEDAGVKRNRDTQEAMRLYSIAANKGFPSAQYRLAVLLLQQDGDSSEPNPEAVRLLRLAGGPGGSLKATSQLASMGLP
ncbi:hypothetical protein Pelo_17939 [Pelomyxa schiedti]|nr:hypothetical protein Pelo_17939 [Pelomyxa schiedti]